MMILQKSRGINNYLEISDVQVPVNYEMGMLTGNSFRFIPPTEIREMDSVRTLYVKIDGMCTLVARFARVKPGVEDVKKLSSDICSCLSELGEYLLDPGGLVIDARYILYNSELDEYRFLYVPGRRQEFRGQIKNLFEEIMRIYDHSDRQGVVYLYDLYSRLLADNFTPELFVKLVGGDSKAHAGDTGYNNDLKGVKENYSEEESFHQSEKALNARNKEYLVSKELDEVTRGNVRYNTTVYIVGAIALAVTSIALFILFGIKSLKFTAVLMAALVAYIVIDVIHIKEEAEMDNSMQIEKEKDLAGKKSIQERKSEIENDEYGAAPVFIDTETSVLVPETGVQIVSRLVPMDSMRGEQIYLIEGETRVGRQSDVCDYCLEDPSISRVHAILEKEGDKLQILDPGSTNGIYLNDKRIPVNQPVEAFCGDKVCFARLEYECM